MPRQCPAPNCGRPCRPHNRHCWRHAARVKRYGAATAMPLRYRSAIKPHYAAWAADGFARYADHPATQAALGLADELLNYRGAQGFSYQTKLANYLEHLRHAGITPRDVLVRVTELAGFMEAHPERFRSQREEDFALARGVLYLVAHTLHSRPDGARILLALGPMVRQLCLPFALGLARRLEKDSDDRAALLKLSGNLT
jgi:hypothetical protein